MRALLVALLLAALPLALAWAGSARLLGLWTAEQLAASEPEARQGRLGPADERPPERTSPEHQLPALPQAFGAGVIRGFDLPDGDRRVALTFDLCELADRTAGYQGQVVDLLRARGAKATFFAGGKWMRSHPERTLQLMADPHFELGNHAWTHGNFGVLDRQAMADQVLWTQAQYELLRQDLDRRARAAGLEADMAAVPQALVLFRLPYGRCRPESLELLASLGLPAIQWTHVAEEGRAAEAPELRARRLAARLRPGDVVLMHANGVPAQTAPLLATLLEELARRGLTTATVSELLATGRPRFEAQGYFATPGDNLGLDAHYGDGTRHPRLGRPERP